jgi:hypothetical protein
MTTLNNPVTSQNIVDRFYDYVNYTASQGVTWGSDVIPAGDTSPVSGVAASVPIIASTDFAGTVAAVTDIAINGASIGSSGGTITASDIWSVLVNETSRETHIRYVQAICGVTGTGGNAGTRLRNTTTNSDPNRVQDVYNLTRVANMRAGFASGITNPAASTYSLTAGSTISSTNLESFFSACRDAYNNAARATGSAYVYRTNVCHASCHSSCHSSRGRR